MNRRKFLKDVGLTGAALLGSELLPPSPRTAAAAAPAARGRRGSGPNILIIIVDQLRFPQGSFNQSLMDQAAPNLAKLRQQSVSFVSHYGAATACSPSRSTMVTGLYTHQNGMFLTNVKGLLNAASTPDLNPGFPTWGSILSSPRFGYQTNWWGKWHLSANDQTDGDYRPYGFNQDYPVGLPVPSPNGGPGQGAGVDPLTTLVFKDWLSSIGEAGPWCTTVSLVNPHDIAWFPKYSMTAIGETDPPPIPQFHAGLPANFEQWPEALFNEGKPTLQFAWTVIADAVFGFVPQRPLPAGPKFPDIWFQLLDLYYLATQYVDVQIGAVLSALESSGLADNTIVIFTSDHGEYGGAHGLRGKAFGLYEESTHVPLYVMDPTGTFIPPDQGGTSRTGLTSHVDFVPLLMTLASGSNAWRRQPRYAHLAGRADLAEMLRNPAAPGRPYILHTSDEDIPEEGPKVGFSYRDILLRNVLPPSGLPQRHPPSHAIGYRTTTAKLGVYSYFAPGTIHIETSGQQSEMYDYQTYGPSEVVNNAPNGSHPEPGLYNPLYNALFDPTTGAVANELRRPLPAYLRHVQREAINAYLAYEASLGS